jgi:hypothetical protein
MQKQLTRQLPDRTRPPVVPPVRGDHGFPGRAPSTDS